MTLTVGALCRSYYSCGAVGTIPTCLEGSACPCCKLVCRVGHCCLRRLKIGCMGSNTRDVARRSGVRPFLVSGFRFEGTCYRLRVICR